MEVPSALYESTQVSMDDYREHLNKAPLLPLSMLSLVPWIRRILKQMLNSSMIKLGNFSLAFSKGETQTN